MYQIPLLALMKMTEGEEMNVHSEREDTEVEEELRRAAARFDHEVMSWYARAPTIPKPTPQTATRKTRSQSPPCLTQRTPVSQMQAAIEAFTWRTIDAELAELVFDSLADQDEMSLVRGPPQRRLLSFEAGGQTIDLEVTSTSSSRGLVGQLIPARQASVEIRVGASAIAVDADELGRFRADAVPAGPMSLRCSAAPAEPGTAVVTDWVSI